MAQEFNSAVLTNQGAELLTKAQAGEAQIEFTYMKVGDGEYTEDEKSVFALQEATGLKSLQNEYAFSFKSVYSSTTLLLSAYITNYDSNNKSIVSTGYYINEIGLYAKDTANGGSEILYSIAVVSGDQGDYMPAYTGSNPVQIAQEYYVTVGNVAEVTVNMTGVYATAEDLQNIQDKIGTTDISGIGDGTITGAIQAEVSAREAADNSLSTDISSEATARATADSSLSADISSEATARATADSSLSADISAEATARATADSTLEKAIADETSARELAISNLSEQLTADLTSLTERVKALEEALDSHAIRTVEELPSTTNPDTLYFIDEG